MVGRWRQIAWWGLVGVVGGVFGSTFPAGAESIVLWNKLGSLEEVSTSAIGPGFQAHSDAQGGVQFVSGMFGNGLGTTGGGTGGGGYLTMAPDDFFGADKTRGTVELWVQKRIQQMIPYQTPLVGLFGAQPYDSQGGERSYRTISAWWSDGYTGDGGLQFQIYDENVQNHHINDLGWNQVPVGQWVHLAFVWDLNGIDGTTDRMRIYRDGSVVASGSEDFTTVETYDAPVKILGHHAYARLGESSAYLDNLVVYDFAKTDFSERDRETPIMPDYYPFATLSASTAWSFGPGEDDDQLDISCVFSLAAESDGLALSEDTIHLTFADFTLNLAAEDLRYAAGGVTYHDEENTLKLTLRPLGRGRAGGHSSGKGREGQYRLMLSARQLSLQLSSLPPAVTLQIGNDYGEQTLNTGRAIFQHQDLDE